MWRENQNPELFSHSAARYAILFYWIVTPKNALLLLKMFPCIEFEVPSIFFLKVCFNKNFPFFYSIFHKSVYNVQCMQNERERVLNGFVFIHGCVILVIGFYASFGCVAMALVLGNLNFCSWKFWLKQFKRKMS